MAIGPNWSPHPGQAFIVYRVGLTATWTGPMWSNRKLARGSAAWAAKMGLRPMCVVVLKEIRRG